MNINLNARPTAADREEVKRLREEAHRSGKSADGWKIHDLLVSCYVSSGEDGRPEEVHEQRMSDRSCRCGKYAA